MGSNTIFEFNSKKNKKSVSKKKASIPNNFKKTKLRANVTIQNALGLKQTDWFAKAKKNQADAVKDFQMLSEKYTLHDESKKNTGEMKLDIDATLQEDSFKMYC